MAEQLPDLIDPLRLVQRGADLRGSLPLAQMARVRESVLEAAGSAEVELHFCRQGSVAAIDGRVVATLWLECQNCLQPLAWQVNSEVHLGVVASLEEAGLLPEPYEPLLLDQESRIRLLDIVEEELLLALPIVPRHRECCEPAAEAGGEQKAHPFAALAALKSNVK